MNLHYSVIIIGAGAAGVFAAINLKTFNPSLSVIILEKSKQSLAKVKISGGGRCNVTHACFDPAELIKFYPRGQKELRGPFAQFQPGDTIAWFSERGVELKIEEDGRMFPTTDSSQTIIDCFMDELKQLDIPILYQQKVNSIKKISNGFQIGEFTCEQCIVTTGGFNKLEQYKFLTDLGIDIIPPAPSLFTFNLPNHPILKLQGLVAHAEIKVNGTKFIEDGPLLITHWGMSGPAVLKLSAWAARELQSKNYEFDFAVNWLPQLNDEAAKNILNETKQRTGSKKIANHLPFDIPKKLQLFIFELAQIDINKNWAELNKKEINRLLSLLLNHQFKSKGKTTFKQEFVSCGGVSLKSVNFKTMESKIVPQLYFAGEVLNIDALTGGFNFQAAWTTAFIAAQSVAKA